MPVVKDAIPFTISVTGDTTGEKWVGSFKAKARLSHRDQLTKDRIRRELLGPDAGNASTRALNQSEIFAQLTVRLSESPSWWRDSGNGLDLADDNVVAEVFEACLRIERESLDALTKEGEEAKAELQKNEAK
jgi:hypothetical protein